MRFITRFFLGCPRFYLRSSVNLTIGLAVGGAVLIVRKVAIDLSGWSLRNKLISFLRCLTAEASSQVFYNTLTLCWWYFSQIFGQMSICLSNILSMKPNSKNLVDNLILTLSYRLRCLKLVFFYIFRYCYLHQILFVWLICLSAPSWWCLILVVTHKNCQEFSIF